MKNNKDIERCKELIKAEHANWIGLTNQDAISSVLSELETYKSKISEIKKWCDAIVNSEYDSRFYIDGKEIWTDTSACCDLAYPILEIINKKEVEKYE